jgi:phosphate transport system substrate-binding protein
MKSLIQRFGPAVLALACGTLGPGAAPLTAAETIALNGSGSALDMMRPLLEAYQKAHPEVVISMARPLGSSGALKALLAGALDLAVSSKPPRAEDRAKGILFQDYAETPLVIIAEANVARTDMTTAELTAIYAGKVRAWSDGTSIRVILRPEGDVDTQILEALSPTMQAALSAARNKPGMIMAVSDPEANELVMKTAGALGASGLCSLQPKQAGIKVLTFNGVQGTPRNLANGTYPLVKHIRFATTARTSAATLALLEFVYSAKGRAIAEKTGVRVVAQGRHHD